MARHRTIDRTICGLFLLGLVLPLLWAHDPDTLAEKRSPAPSPDWKVSRNFPDQFEAYFRDRFGLRHQMVQLHTWLRYYLLHESPIHDVSLGKDDWLFFEFMDNTANFMGRRPLHDDEMQRWRDVLVRRRDALARRGIPFLFVVVPDKQAIYPEHLPHDSNRPGRTRLDQLLDYLAEHSDLEVLDLRPALLHAKEEGEVFLRYDSHWSDRGAQVGCTEIVRKLSQWFPNLQPWPLSDFAPVLLENPEGDLAQMIGMPSPVIHPAEILVPLRPRRATVCEVPPIPDSPHRWAALSVAKRATACADPSLPRAVIFNDSFHLALQPFLSEHFQYAVYVWQQTVQFPIVDQVKPDIVIQEMCERFLCGMPQVDDSEEDECE